MITKRHNLTINLSDGSKSVVSFDVDDGMSAFEIWAKEQPPKDDGSKYTIEEFLEYTKANQIEKIEIITDGVVTDVISVEEAIRKILIEMNIGKFEDVPMDDKIYYRKNQQWVNIEDEEYNKKIFTCKKLIQLSENDNHNIIIGSKEFLDLIGVESNKTNHFEVWDNEYYEIKPYLSKNIVISYPHTTYFNTDEERNNHIPNSYTIIALKDNYSFCFQFTSDLSIDQNDPTNYRKFISIKQIYDNVGINKLPIMSSNKFYTYNLEDYWSYMIHSEGSSTEKYDFGVLVNSIVSFEPENENDDFEMEVQRSNISNIKKTYRHFMKHSEISVRYKDSFILIKKNGDNSISFSQSYSINESYKNSNNNYFSRSEPIYGIYDLKEFIPDPLTNKYVVCIEASLDKESDTSSEYYDSLNYFRYRLLNKYTGKFVTYSELINDLENSEVVVNGQTNCLVLFVPQIYYNFDVMKFPNSLFSYIIKYSSNNNKNYDFDDLTYSQNAVGKLNITKVEPVTQQPIKNSYENVNLSMEFPYGENYILPNEYDENGKSLRRKTFLIAETDNNYSINNTDFIDVGTRLTENLVYFDLSGSNSRLKNCNGVFNGNLQIRSDNLKSASSQGCLSYGETSKLRLKLSDDINVVDYEIDVIKKYIGDNIVFECVTYNKENPNKKINIGDTFVFKYALFDLSTNKYISPENYTQVHHGGDDAKRFTNDGVYCYCESILEKYENYSSEQNVTIIYNGITIIYSKVLYCGTSNLFEFKAEDTITLTLPNNNYYFEIPTRFFDTTDELISLTLPIIDGGDIIQESYNHVKAKFTKSTTFEIVAKCGDKSITQKYNVILK